jgi:cadmium resistance protein CadD (predicted permease)
VCFFSAKTFLILAIVIVKIVCLGFLASRASRVALIMQISRVLSLFRSSIVSYIVSFLGLGLVLGIELVLDLGSGSLSILFIVGY